MEIRPALPSDAEHILRIYAPFVEHTAVTFEYRLPSVQEMQQRIERYTQQYPWLVAVRGHQVLGYAYASAYRERMAYQWCCESSIYMHPDAQGTGVAQPLYEKLMEKLTAQGFFRVYAVITHPNEQSEKFHARCGFRSFALFENVGYKLDRWHDVLWMVRELRSASTKPNQLLKPGAVE